MSSKTRKCIVTGIFAIILIGMGSLLWWNHVRWPVGEFLAEVREPDSWKLGETVELLIHTNQEYERTQRLEINLSVEEQGLDVVSSTLFRNGENASFRIELIARRPMLERTLAWQLQRGRRVMRTGQLTATVEPPVLGSDQPATFAEMIQAPDHSIHGSHITVWNAPGAGELLTVTGHAASSVCRTASSAMFGLARHGNIESPAFFLGAGMGVIDTSGLEKGIAEDIKAFEIKYPALTKGIESAVATILHEQSELLALGEMLARLSGDADSLLELEKLKAMAAEKARHDVLSTLSSAISGNWTVGIQASDAEIVQRQQALSRLAQKKASELTEDDGRALRLLLTGPEKTVAAFWQNENESINACMSVYRNLSEQEQSDAGRLLENLVVRIRALETVVGDFNDLAKATGLLKIKDDSTTLRHPENIETVRDAVAAWSAYATGKDALDLNALAGGHRGTLLLPYYDFQGKAVSFLLPAELLQHGDGESLRDLMRSMTAIEMEEIARAAAQRLESTYVETMERLTQYNSLAMAMRMPGSRTAETSPAWSAWLSESRSVMVSEIDERGRQRGTREVKKTNLELIRDAWHTAAAARRLQMFYLRLAEDARNAFNDKVFQAINDRVLIDSLLRGWSLAFTDEEMEKRFEDWSARYRISAWESIWRQAMEFGIDPLVFFNEGTVFQVRENNGGFVIQPVFVANILETRCVRDPAMGVVRYDTPWLHRNHRTFRAEAAASEIKSPAQLAETTMDSVLADLYEKADEMDGQNAFKVMDDLKAHLPFDAWGTDIQLAFYAAPEHAAARLTEAFLDFWAPTSPHRLDSVDIERGRKIDEYEAMEDDLNSLWNSIKEQLQNGTWPFADQYALFTLVFQEMAKSGKTEQEQQFMGNLAESLEKHGRRIDNAFMSEMLERGRISRRSEGYTKAQARFDAWRSERSVLRVFQTVVLLGEAGRILEGYRSPDGILHRMILLERDIAAYENRDPRDFNAKIGDDLGDEEAITGLIKNLAEDFARAEKRLAALPGGEHDNGVWHLKARCRLLAQQARRMSVETGTEQNRNSLLDVLSDTMEILSHQSWEHAQWFSDPSENALGELQKIVEKIRTGDFDALARRLLRVQLSDVSGLLAQSAVAEIQNDHREAPNRRTLEMLVQLHWGMGRYKHAIELLAKETMQHIVRSANEETHTGAQKLWRGLILVQLFSELQDNLLKACVYSGDDFFGTSIFGKRQSDWVARPRTLDEVVVSIVAELDGFMDSETAAGFSSVLERAAAGEILDVSAESPLTVGPYRVTGLHVRPQGEYEFQVQGPSGHGLLRLFPNDPTGRNHARAIAGTELAAALARTDTTGPKHLLLTAGKTPLVYADERVVMTLEAGNEVAHQNLVVTAHKHPEFPNQLYLSNGRWVDTSDLNGIVRELPEGAMIALPGESVDLCAGLRQNLQARSKNLRFYVSEKANRGEVNLAQLSASTFSMHDTEIINESELQDLVIEKDDSIVLFVRAGRNPDRAREEFDQKLQQALDADRFDNKRIALVALDDGEVSERTRIQQLTWLESVRERILQAGASMFCTPSRFIGNAAGMALIDAARSILQSGETLKDLKDLSEVMDEAVRRVREGQSDETLPDTLPEDFRMVPFTHRHTGTSGGLA